MRTRPLSFLKKWLFPSIGFISLIWFLTRVIPKPNRVTYPCLRVATPLASSFFVWVLGMCGSIIALRSARRQIRGMRYLKAALCVVAAGGAIWFGFSGMDRMAASAQKALPLQVNFEADQTNEPIGNPKGVYPGRVVWVHDPDATDWDGPASGESCWEPDNTNQVVVDDMLSKAIRWLAPSSRIRS